MWLENTYITMLLISPQTCNPSTDSQFCNSLTHWLTHFPYVYSTLCSLLNPLTTPLPHHFSPDRHMTCSLPPLLPWSYLLLHHKPYLSSALFNFTAFTTTWHITSFTYLLINSVSPLAYRLKKAQSLIQSLKHERKYLLNGRLNLLYHSKQTPLEKKNYITESREI